MTNPPQRVVVLGASDKPERYSNMAVVLLREHGHDVVPIHPALPEIEGIPAHPSFETIEGEVDTLTVYVNPTISAGLTSQMIALRPKRVIFNPGSEPGSSGCRWSDYEQIKVGRGVPAEPGQRHQTVSATTNAGVTFVPDKRHRPA